MTTRFRKIIILGHSGFIGTHLTRVFALSKSWEVMGFSIEDIDLTRVEGTSRLIPFLTEESVLLLASAVKRQFGDTLEAFRQNMTIAKNIYRLLEKNPVKKIIFMSSAAVYGEESENTSIHEQTLVNPMSFYGISKYATECLLRKVCNLSKDKALVCLRPPLIYGPNDQGRSYGPSGFCAAALGGTPITLWGDGTELREFVYVEDLCRVIEYLADSPFQGELNVVSGVSYSFADVIALLKTTFPNLNVTNRPRTKQKVNNVFIPDKIKSVLPYGFEFTSLEDGLNMILNKN